MIYNIYLGIYFLLKGFKMQTAKLFMNGSSQAVRLPKECRFNGQDVYIKKFENAIMLIPKDDPWASFVDSLDHFSEDFMEDRKQPLLQKREDL
jgi:antitoxin VapB